MKTLLNILVSILMFGYISTECCGNYKILYNLRDGYDCDDVPGGSKNDGETVFSVIAKMDKYQPKVLKSIDQQRRDSHRPDCVVKVCYDGRWYGGWYCGHGPCNVFGCNCDGGCIRGVGNQKESPYENFMDNYSNIVESAVLKKEVDKWFPQSK